MERRSTIPADLLDDISYVMDRLLQIPGTRLRIGLNALFFALPFAGDIVPSLVSVGILAIAIGVYGGRLPKIVIARMVLNTVLDAAIGWIPVLGDLFDIFFKADTRNVRLLQRYALADASHSPATAGHWVFVVGVLAAIVLFFCAFTFLTLWILVHLFLFLFQALR